VKSVLSARLSVLFEKRSSFYITPSTELIAKKGTWGKRDKELNPPKSAPRAHGITLTHIKVSTKDLQLPKNSKRLARKHVNCLWERGGASGEKQKRKKKSTRGP